MGIKRESFMKNYSEKLLFSAFFSYSLTYIYTVIIQLVTIQHDMTLFFIQFHEIIGKPAVNALRPLKFGQELSKTFDYIAYAFLLRGVAKNSQTEGLTFPISVHISFHDVNA